MALRRRLDVKVDHANAALLEHVHALRDRGARVFLVLDRTDADRALCFRQLRDIRNRVFHAKADPAVLLLAAAILRDVILMELVVEVGAVVVDDDEQRDLVLRSAPDRRRPAW